MDRNYESLPVALGRMGLIQFGRFIQPDGAIWPVAVHLRWLPSYPALLNRVAGELAPLLTGIEVDRLLTTQAAIPVGTALSLRAGLPMVYPFGAARDHTDAFMIEGAYDVGHPTVLLSDVLIDSEQANTIAHLAQRVGLEIGTVLAVLDLGRGARAALVESGYEVRCLLSLRDVLPQLQVVGLLRPPMRAAVEAWQAAMQVS